MYDCQVNCKAHVALPTILHTIHLAYTEFPIVWTTLLKVRVPTGQLASTHDCHVSVMRTVFGFCNHEWWTGRLWLSKYLQSQMYLFPQCYKPKTQCWGWCMYLLLRASQFYRKPLHGQTLNMGLLKTWFASRKCSKQALTKQGWVPQPCPKTGMCDRNRTNDSKTHPVHDTHVCIAIWDPVIVDCQLGKEAAPQQACVGVAYVTWLVGPCYDLQHKDP